MTEQINMFQMLEDCLTPERQKFRRALRRGSGFEGGKQRILEKANELSKPEFISFLKKEYGIGGGSFEGGFLDYSSKGICITEKGWVNKKNYSWTIVADEILDLIQTDSY